MISFESVSVARQGRTILGGVSLDLTECRIGIIGANGSGKSTLVRLINGLILPTQGTVRVDGLTTAANVDAVRQKVGFVFQNPDNQIVFPSVAEDLAFGLKNQGLDKHVIDKRVGDILARFDLGDLADRPTYHLSGGEKQMIALLGVLIMEPEVIVLDEPTTLLDRRNSRALLRTLEALDQMLIVITHDLDMLRGFDRVLCLDGGGIHADGAPAEVIAAYEAISA